MYKPEYMKVQMTYFPEDVKEKYNLDPLNHKDYIYIKIKKGGYGLKQASVLAYQQLSTILIDDS